MSRSKGRVSGPFAARFDTHLGQATETLDFEELLSFIRESPIQQTCIHLVSRVHFFSNSRCEDLQFIDEFVLLRWSCTGITTSLEWGIWQALTARLGVYFGTRMRLPTTKSFKNPVDDRAASPQRRGPTFLIHSFCARFRLFELNFKSTSFRERLS